MRQLFPHQKNAINAALTLPSLLVIRSPGTGKTAIGIHVADRSACTDQLPALWICPSHLIEQLKGEWKEWNLNTVLLEYAPQVLCSANCCYYISYDKARSWFSSLKKTKWAVVVVDEVHRANNVHSKTYRVVSGVRKLTNRLVGLTATPFQNDPYQFFNLLSIFSDKNVTDDLDDCLEYRVPKKKTFKRRFLSKLGLRLPRLNQGPVVGIKDRKQFAFLVGSVANLMPDSTSRFEASVPNVVYTNEVVHLSVREQEIHYSLLKKNRRKTDRALIADALADCDVESAVRRFTDARQSLISIDGIPATKTTAIAAEIRNLIKDSEKRVLVFCNFVNKGAAIISEHLNSERISHQLYTGATPTTKRNEIIQLFLKGDNRVLILSPVGFEGLNLSGTTNILIAEPHFNPEKTLQLLSRALRAFSPVSVVSVKHFVCTMDKGGRRTTDEIIMRIAERKRLINDLMCKCVLECSASHVLADSIAPY